MRITAAGDVGIGTASPVTYGNGGLVLGTTSSGKSILLFSSSNGNNGVIGFRDLNNADAYQIAAGTSNITFYGYGSRPMQFYTNGTERMVISSAGDVGIGTVSPAVKLDVNGGINLAAGNSITWGGAYGANIPTIAGSSSAHLAFYPAGSTSGEKMRINSDGEVWIGYTTDQGAYALQVNGSVYATSYFESSDERLKNIAVAYQSDNFGALEFTWKDGRDSKNHWGYSAQAVQKWLPDAVQENNDGYLTVDYNQAHTFKIQKLEEEIKLLKEQIKNN
jgi:hypothetical protein